MTDHFTAPLERSRFCYSIVVPVFNSEAVVGTTVDQIVAVFEQAGLDFELILVNDGSRDDSWDVIAAKAGAHERVTALNLLRNYGQHHANLAGFRESTGDYVITMDDDLQNPPEEALTLIDAAMDGYDVVFGDFDRKKAPAYRQLGSKLISLINRRVFHQPHDLVVSNFRILRRDVVDRICASPTAEPYITGQALLYSHRRGNVKVRHEPRRVGASTYTLFRILRLVFTILFSYSLFPLRAAALAGAVIAGLSFAVGLGYLVRAVFVDTQVEGWTTLVVLLAMFSGVIIALLSMLGEYLVRIQRSVTAHESYHVIERVPQRSAS